MSNLPTPTKSKKPPLKGSSPKNHQNNNNQKNIKKPELKHPQQEYGMNNLMKLEKELLEGKFDFHSIQELVRIYTGFVEYYDSKHEIWPKN